MKNSELFTVGYEGREINEFVNYLKQFNVSRLIDVRELPLSRKAGFSKSSLKKRLEDENIQYVHLKSLGSPSLIRNKLKSDQDYDYFFKEYTEYLSGKLNALEELYDYVSDGINCIMCFERSPKKCHRTVIVEKVQVHNGNQFEVKHI
jgi:uncharacterized protein (DUF488 family)